MSRGLRLSSELDLERIRSERRERSQRAGAPPVAERDVLAAVLELLEHHPRVAWCRRFNTGATKFTGADGKTRWVSFAFRGCSDVLGQLRPVPPNPIGAFLAIECKRDGEKPTEEQAAFLDTVSAAGGTAFVARSVDDVMRALG
jgi:hypothetical protein